MHAVYNGAAVEWSIASINPEHFRNLVKIYHEKNPKRFHQNEVPFTICDYGCTNGGSSVAPLREIINSVRAINPSLPIIVYLNDLPECRFDMTFATVNTGLGDDLQEVYIMAVGKDFTS